MNLKWSEWSTRKKVAVVGAGVLLGLLAATNDAEKEPAGNDSKQESTKAELALKSMVVRLPEGGDPATGMKTMLLALDYLEAQSETNSYIKAKNRPDEKDQPTFHPIFRKKGDPISFYDRPRVLMDESLTPGKDVFPRDIWTWTVEWPRHGWEGDRGVATVRFSFTKDHAEIAKAVPMQIASLSALDCWRRYEMQGERCD